VIAVDTSVVIAGLLSWHEFHESAAAALNGLIGRRLLLLPQPVLIESYSVMTRLPSPHRLRAEVAHELLAASFKDVPIGVLPPRKSWDFLQTCVSEGVAGGRTYDAAIALIAIDAGATEFLTFNPRDFEAFADHITVSVPA
jgi:predicted nucleic acid-binding protein